MRLPIDARTRVLVLTGAGVSAESGVPTFRAAGGLWENHPIEQVASPEGFREDPALVWRFYSDRRVAARAVAPNPGHHALVRLEERLGDRFLLATQNVDDLHRRAGSRRIVEMHGNLFLTRCSRCERPPSADEAEHRGELPTCALCAARGERALLRPHIVWFGEMLATGDTWRIRQFIHGAGRHGTDGERLLFVAAGTSGVVWPAAGMVDSVRVVGGESWLVNVEEPANADRFDHFVQGKSGEVLPELLG